MCLFTCTVIINKMVSLFGFTHSPPDKKCLVPVVLELIKTCDKLGHVMCRTEVNRKHVFVINKDWRFTIHWNQCWFSRTYKCPIFMKFLSHVEHSKVNIL